MGNLGKEYEHQQRDEMEGCSEIFEEEKQRVLTPASIQSLLRFRAYKLTIKGFLRFFFLDEREDIDPTSIPEHSWRWSVIKAKADE